MDDMDRPWTEFLSEVLTMLIYGWSLHEIVYKIRGGPFREISSQYSDGKIGWRRLPIRGQDSLFRWEFAENGSDLEGFIQMPPPDYQQIFIPAKKFILFRTSARRGNPEGRSFLRNAYRPWFFKKRIEEYEGIGIERDLAGLPMAYVPKELMTDSASPEEKAIYEMIKNIIRNVRNDSMAGVIFPQVYDSSGNKLYEFQLLSAGGRRNFDTNEVIIRYDQRIAGCMLADFILLGQRNVGSFALASEKTDLFASALGALMDSIAEVLNREAIPKLFAVNGWTGECPYIVHGDIETPDLDKLSNFILRLSNAGALKVPDEGLERHLRRVASLPEIED